MGYIVQPNSNRALPRPMTRRGLAKQDPSMAQIRKASAAALCTLTAKDPLLSAARPAGRLFATLIITLVISSSLSFVWPHFLDVVGLWVFSFSAGIGLFRLWACLTHFPVRRRRIRFALPKAPIIAHDYPVWTILVALYQEGDSVPSLIKSLKALAWPADKLDVIFACEADDEETLGTLAAWRAHLPCRVISVPKGGPRTKPKALQTALPFARGTFLTVYDAEDRPDPNQLIAAWQAFRAGPANLAVVQAPLVVWNARESWITRQFAMDYAIWFLVVLPALAKIAGFFPLGGTSNHFAVHHLRRAGGWDPYNVTEDADLGVRFARMGLLAALIDRPTFEEGAPTLGGWTRQRGRWIQGHIQTVSLHLRRPVTLARDIGVRGLFVFVLGFVSGPLSAALVLVSWLVALASIYSGLWQEPAIWFVIMMISQFGVGLVAMHRDGRRSLLSACLMFPLYQACQIPALCRALWRIYLSPSIWDKTKHGKSARTKKPAQTSIYNHTSERETWIGPPH
jgi:cellulose synthase/poly-beta-1,6-N-acetylglucosamine synthase-like glycosyltransferase